MDAGKYLWGLTGGNRGIVNAYIAGGAGATADLVSNATVGATNRIVPVWVLITASGAAGANPLELRATDNSNTMFKLPLINTATYPKFFMYGVRFINTFSAGMGIEYVIGIHQNTSITMGYYLIPV